MRKQLMTEMLACMLTTRLRRRKNFFKLASIIALVTVIFFGMMSCDDGSTNGGGSGEELPKASGLNAVGGKTYFEENRRIVFYTTANSASSGSYTIKRGEWDDWKFTDQEDQVTGNYTWNEGAKTVTLKPEKAAGLNGTLVGQAKFRQDVQAALNQAKQQMGKEAFNQLLSSMGFSSESAYITYAINETFANKTYSYSFSNDGRALFLEMPLPANKGTNQLAGQTYGMDYNYDDTYEYINIKYFFAPSGNTYTEIFTRSNWDGNVSVRTNAGSYAYDSSMKRVWLRPEKYDGKTRAEYYNDLVGSDSSSDDAAYAASEINWRYSIYKLSYNATNKTMEYYYGGY